jgi:demethylspheroidene O-methyltransferase
MDAQRMTLLLDAGVGIGLLKKQRLGRYGLTRQGAAIVGIPGLRQMILHHSVLYRDMMDPLALLRGETQTELANFWPYVFGAEGANDPETAQRYSDLMADSQGMVARDTMQMVDMRKFKHVLDVGGGTGAFAIALAAHDPNVRVELMDLPSVASAADARIAQAGLTDRITFRPGSFRDDPFPGGADAITLIRVLYDHSDDTVRALLAKVYDRLPPGGTLVVSEPMSGGETPDAITDVYFAFYTLAMRTGRTRSAAQISALMAEVT